MRHKDSEFSQRFGRNLKALRERAGYPTKWALGEASGIKEPTISNYESGKGNPSTLTVLKLCKALGCTIDELIKE